MTSQLNTQTRTISSDALLNKQELNAPYAVYEFGNNRKRFLDIYELPGTYGKPVSIADGVTTHLPDTDLDSTNSPLPDHLTIGR